jgi:hypothetical protein
MSTSEQRKATPEQWEDAGAFATDTRARIEALEATQQRPPHQDKLDRLMQEGGDDGEPIVMPMVLQSLTEVRTEVREFIPAPVTHDLTNAAPLLWVLWNHLGGSSPIGQPIRQYLGMGQFERMTEEQIEAAKQYRDCMAMPTTPPPAGSLMQRVMDVLGHHGDGTARAAILEVAAWLQGQESDLYQLGDALNLLEREANR